MQTEQVHLVTMILDCNIYVLLAIHMLCTTQIYFSVTLPHCQRIKFPQAQIQYWCLVYQHQAAQQGKDTQVWALIITILESVCFRLLSHHGNALIMKWSNNLENGMKLHKSLISFTVRKLPAFMQYTVHKPFILQPLVSCNNNHFYHLFSCHYYTVE